MHNPLLSLLVAFAGYSLLNISQAAQKIGLGVARSRKLTGSLIWAAATLGTSGAAFVNLYALSMGSVTLVGAMAGSGLASLAVFSRLVLKEPIGRRELAGIGVILAAAVLIGAFARAQPPAVPRMAVLYGLLAAISAVYTILWVLFRRRDSLVAMVIAAFAGSLGGFVALFQKISTTDYGRTRSLVRAVDSLRAPPGPVGETLTNPYALAWIVLSILSMLVLQFAYRRGKAIRIIPAFSASFVMVPILGGMLVFGESLHPLQIAGVLLIVAGVLMLTLKPPADAEAENEPGPVDPMADG